MDFIQSASALLAQIVAWATANALVVGAASIVAAVLARALGERWGVLLVAGGAAFAGSLAASEFQSTGGVLIPLAVLAGGVLIAVLAARLLRGVPMVGAVVLFASGWYLILRAFLGPFLLGSVLGDLALGGLILGSALVVHHSMERIESRREPTQPAYPEAVSY